MTNAFDLFFLFFLFFDFQTLGNEIHTNLGGKGGYKDVIDGMGVTITDLEGKFYTV